MATILVTGATDGIGLETAKQLAGQSHRVLVHGRTEAKAQAAVRTVGHASQPVWGDLSSFASVRKLAAQVSRLAPQLDVLLNNAGIFADQRIMTVDGHESTFQVNHLAPFLLAELLRENLLKAGQGRIVNVSSMAHARGRLSLDDPSLAQSFSGTAAYANSKQANVLHVVALAQRLQGTRVTANALHPGVITTKLLQKGFGMSGASVATGAQTSVYCSTAPELVSVTGAYFSDSRQVDSSSRARDRTLADALWDYSVKVCGL
jgi:NAD(P)-dependent dehydrogenase (short-subunit alcohol dehydrogenase family)